MQNLLLHLVHDLIFSLASALFIKLSISLPSMVLLESQWISLLSVESQGKSGKMILPRWTKISPWFLGIFLVKTKWFRYKFFPRYAQNFMWYLPDLCHEVREKCPRYVRGSQEIQIKLTAGNPVKMGSLQHQVAPLKIGLKHPSTNFSNVIALSRWHMAVTVVTDSHRSSTKSLFFNCKVMMLWKIQKIKKYKQCLGIQLTDGPLSQNELVNESWNFASILNCKLVYINN